MEQLSFTFLDNKSETKDLVTIKEAAEWACKFLGKNVTPSNISYLIQYGKINKYYISGNVFVSIEELKRYYQEKYQNNLENNGDGIDWHLSFAQYNEAERTKHVHRIHPYKGKFIPQLVEYFLDKHTDEFKTEVFFHSGDIVLDPFCGSGTTLVQANELGIHAIGVDISQFNKIISNVKVRNHNIENIINHIEKITSEFDKFKHNQKNIIFEKELDEELSKFNKEYFPQHFKKFLKENKIDEKQYSKEKLELFLPKFFELVDKYSLKLLQDKKERFIDKWFLEPVRRELDFLANEIMKIKDQSVREVLMIILSRTARSCRATTHSDLATLKEPVSAPYYCKKHGKICSPVFTVSDWWSYYCEDTIERLKEFQKLRTDTFQICLVGDSRTIDILGELEKVNKDFAEKVKIQKIRGIFSSPPYIGLIDYHEQHAYAYDLFNLKRNDDLEIGPLFKGQGEEQRRSYVESIAQVLVNMKKYLQDDYDVFLVANDKFNLYPQIAEKAGMKIVNEFKRPVLHRVEKNREHLYVESIFHLKEK